MQPNQYHIKALPEGRGQLPVDGSRSDLNY